MKKILHNKFPLVAIVAMTKNFIIGDENVGYILVAERANDIKTAIDERKNFVIRTAILVTLVIFVFSFVFCFIFFCFVFHNRV